MNEYHYFTLFNTKNDRGELFHRLVTFMSSTYQIRLIFQLQLHTNEH